MTGVPVLKLVSADTTENTVNTGSKISSNSPVPSVSKSRKRRANSLEDDEMYAKLRRGDSFERNARQEQELSLLKEGWFCEQYILSIT